MSFSQKVKTKIRDGSLREMWSETRWMIKYIRRYRFVILIHILLGIVGTCMSLLSSIGMKRLIDAVTGFRYSNIWGDALYMAGMLVGSVVLSAIAGRIAAVINIRVQNGIQAEIYDRMLHTDWESLERFRSGDLLQRLNGDVGTVASGVTSFLPSFVTGSVQFVGSLVIILFYDPVMALIALVGAPLSVICSRVLVRRMREYNKTMKAISSEVMSFHDDSFRNLTSIKGFGIMGGFSRRMLDLQKRYRDAFLDYNRFSVVASLVMSLVGLLISAGCFGWGVYRLWTHAITDGLMTMFLQLTGMLRGSFGSIIGLVPTYISITTSAGRLMAVVELPEEPGAREKIDGLDGDCGCVMRNVTFSYQDGENVLEHVDFSVLPGELVRVRIERAENGVLFGSCMKDRGDDRAC
jgi:ABC-type multidrug transport system fused ATPase/permease subunit